MRCSGAFFSIRWQTRRKIISPQPGLPARPAKLHPIAVLLPLPLLRALPLPLRLRLRLRLRQRAFLRRIGPHQAQHGHRWHMCRQEQGRSAVRQSLVALAGALCLGGNSLQNKEESSFTPVAAQASAVQVRDKAVVAAVAVTFPSLAHLGCMVDGTAAVPPRRRRMRLGRRPTGPARDVQMHALVAKTTCGTSSCRLRPCWNRTLGAT